MLLPSSPRALSVGNLITQKREPALPSTGTRRQSDKAATYVRESGDSELERLKVFKPRPSGRTTEF